MIFKIVRWFVRLVLDILEYERVEQIELDARVDFVKPAITKPTVVAQYIPAKGPSYHELGTIEFSKN